MAGPFGYNPYYQNGNYTPGSLYYQNYQQNNAQQMQNGAQQMQQPQMQQPQQASSFVMVRNEEEARNYPVAQGNSVLMRDENAPFIYNKAMGFSQLDRPTFEKYRLVKEDVSEKPYKTQEDAQNGEAIDLSIYALKDETDALQRAIDELEKEVKRLARRKEDDKYE